MSNPNWNKDSNAGRNSKGGVKGNWSDRGTIVGSKRGMGAAPKGGSFKWVGSKDSKW